MYPNCFLYWIHPSSPRNAENHLHNNQYAYLCLASALKRDMQAPLQTKGLRGHGLPRTFRSLHQALHTQTHAKQSGVETTGASRVEPGDGNVWYAAFGSNMNPKVLTDRRGVKPLTSFPCSIPGFTMGFHCQGYSTVEPFERPIPLELEPRSSDVPRATSRLKSIKSRSKALAARWVYGHTVHGVVHLLKREDWARVQLSEGVLPPFTQVLQVGYQVIPVDCELYNGDWVNAETLSASKSFLGDPWSAKPSLRYLNLLQEGARHHGVLSAYCALLDSQPVAGLEVQLNDPLSQALSRFLTF